MLTWHQATSGFPGDIMLVGLLYKLDANACGHHHHYYDITRWNTRDVRLLI